MGPIYFQDLETGRDWGPVAEGLLLAAANALTLNLVEAHKSIREGIERSERVPTVDEKAGIWLRTVAGASLLGLLNEPRFGGPVEKAHRERARTFLAEMLALNGQGVFDHEVAANPVAAALMQEVLRALPAFVREAGADVAANDEEIRRRFAELARSTSARVYALETDYYRELFDGLAGPFAEAYKRDCAWALHANWIAKEFHEGEIFAPRLDRPPSLGDVYHRLRCYWHEEVEAVEREPMRWVAHVGDLHQTLHEWLENGRPRDTLRLVAGGPGSGKSSFARAFATEVVTAGRYRVVFVPLQRMDLQGDLYYAVGNTLRKLWAAAAREEGFEQNPLEMRLDEAGATLLPARMLLVFDGLDELSRGEDEVKMLAQKFMTKVKDLLRDLDRDEAPVRALVLGRSWACQEGLKAADLEPEVLIHVAPLVPIDKKALGFRNLERPSEQARVTVADPFRLAVSDERPAFWTRSAPALGLADEPVPEAVTGLNLGELNAEPLLLHLLMITGYTGEMWEAAARNPNRNGVYEAIFKQIYCRDREKEHPVLKGIKLEDYLTLLECLGLAACRDNTWTGSPAGFEAVRELHAHDLEVSASDFRNVAVLTYTRRDLEGRGFEFIHKSFGEYLAGRGLLSAGDQLARKLGDNPSKRRLHDAAKDWSELIGRLELTEEILRFLGHEARLRGVFEAKAKPYLEPLGALFDWTIANGIPAHKVWSQLSWREMEAAQRCAESALLAVANAGILAQRSAQRPAPSWIGLAVDWADEPRSAFHFLNRILVTSWHPARLCLAALDLRGADLVGADIRGADLRGANLRRADLRGADLRWTDLRGAQLGGANLLGADVGEGDLRWADLRGVDLRGANLLGADLAEADLALATLRSTDCSGCNGLSDRAAASAFGVRSGAGLTRLPEGMKPPEHWHVAGENDSPEEAAAYEFSLSELAGRAIGRLDGGFGLVPCLQGTVW